MVRFSNTEKVFFNNSRRDIPKTNIPYIVVENFPELGVFTALRFLEWTHDNPEGVISLPTGKTPEFFIKWVIHLLENWNNKKLTRLRHKLGFLIKNKPVLKGLNFVQIDEFYPINPTQHNSFYYYINKYYIQGFGLDKSRAQLINCEDIPRLAGFPLRQIFPDNRVDLSLRVRECKTDQEKLQQETIRMVDQWCAEYEDKIRKKGGIGFFLGGIGPDGHIAFNVRGSDHNSTTRLTETNFETQAASAVDLGGIEISRNRLVITIGLSTITYNPDTVAIITAAGEAKADIVEKSIESKPTIIYPATALHKLSESRFYLTKGASSKLQESVKSYYSMGSWTKEKTERAVIDLCVKSNLYGSRLTEEILKNNPYTNRIPNIDVKTVDEVISSLQRKIGRGLKSDKHEVFLHTGPHHDDIMLAYLPFIVHLVRSPLNVHHFSVLTSGFTSVTNDYLRRVLINTKNLFDEGRIEMTAYPDFFEKGYKYKWDKDVYHYLNHVAGNNKEGQKRGRSHRIVRALVDIYRVVSIDELCKKIDDIITYIDSCYDGEKNPPDIQQLKGMLREFEEELVWAHYGVQVRNVHHLRLGFYTGEVFNEIPDRLRDVEPFLRLLKKVEPTILTISLDPEGSGPDTHYKVLQTIAEAVREWEKTHDVSKLRIWGYRNVWYQFHPSEADVIVPVSLNSMAVLRDTFMTCYLSQKEASFPSYEFDGPFCDLAQKIWVEQHQLLELVLGRDYWYQNDHPRLRATHGVIFLREMNVDAFLGEARRLEQSMETQIA